MATEKLNGKVMRKAGNGKGFMIEGVDGWFNTSEAVLRLWPKSKLGQM